MYWLANGGSDLLSRMLYFEHIRKCKSTDYSTEELSLQTANQLSPKDLLYNPVRLSEVKHTHRHMHWGISTRHGNQEDLALGYSMLPTKEIAL